MIDEKKITLAKYQIEILPKLTPRQASLRFNSGQKILLLKREKNSFILVDQNSHPNLGMYEFLDISKKYTILLFCPEESDTLYHTFEIRRFKYTVGTFLLFLSIPFMLLYFNYPETARISKDQCLFLGLSLSLIGTHFMVKLSNLFEEYHKEYKSKFYSAPFN